MNDSSAYGGVGVIVLGLLNITVPLLCVLRALLTAEQCYNRPRQPAPTLPALPAAGSKRGRGGRGGRGGPVTVERWENVRLEYFECTLENKD